MQRKTRLRARLTSKAAFRKQLRLALEPLELRSMLALILPGGPLETPELSYANFLIEPAPLIYNAATDQLSMVAEPFSFKLTATSEALWVLDSTLQINIGVDSAGNLLPGGTLLVTGDIYDPETFDLLYIGPLLTGNVIAFGYSDAAIGNTDRFEFIVQPTGGAIASLYTGKLIGLRTDSENSSFSGTFTTNFGGLAKGNLGAIDQPVPELPVIETRIRIEQSGTNEVSHAHSFTTIVEVNDNLPIGAPNGDNAAGFRPATDDEVESIVVSLENSNGADASILSPADPESDEMVSSETNNFVVNFNSPSAGVVTGSAIATLVINNHTYLAETKEVTGIGGPAIKTYVDANITITPDATNEVGQSHTFIVTVQEDNGDGIDSDGDGSTFDPAVNKTVTVTLANANGAGPAGPFVITTNSAGQGTVTFVSATAGIVTANASTTFLVGGVSLTRDTNPATADIGAGPGGSGPAVKTYVDANITITPNAVNEVGKPHTFTVTVTENAGHGAGFVAAAGETVTLTLQNTNGASAPTTTYTGTTNSSGQFQVTFASPTAGQVIANASGTIIVGGLTLTRDTNPATANIGAGPGGSGPATKTFVDARIILSPPTATNPINDSHIIYATVEQNDGLNANQGGDGVTGFAPAPNGTSVTFALTNSNGASAQFVGASTAIVSGGVAAVTINSTTAGTVTINGTTTFFVGGESLTRDTNPTTTPVAGPGGSGPVTKIYVTPGIDIEKTTNGPSNSNPIAPNYDNEDTADGPGVPVLTPGTAVNWTYKVTNTGQLPFAFNEVVIVDDNGTTATGDDLSTTGGQITFQSVQTGDADNILEPGEVWIYKATGTVLTLPGASSGSPVTFNFSGNSALDGTDGNVRTYTAGGVSVKVSAFSRDKTSGAWSTAWLGTYGDGLGVTDSSEGNGGSNSHTVDNIGRDNYVLLEFDRDVNLDSVFLGYVVGDSDIKVWIGTRTDPFNNHVVLSDAVLSGLGFSEVNVTDSSSTRTAVLNTGNVVGNVVVIAADPGDTSPEDQFKIETLKARPATQGYYKNNAVVTVPGASDSDWSHYTNPKQTPRIDIEKTTNGPTNSNTTVPDYDNEDVPNGAGVPILTAGSTVTWTYKVTNTGTTVFPKDQVVVSDDNGTSSTADDLSTTNGKITFLSVQTGDSDNLLEPGEVWLYKATGVVQTLSGSTPGAATTFDFSGNSSVSGSAGNVRTFTQDSISVKASAFSRDKSSGAWATAYLGSYAGGLGVTDGSENGSSDTHTVDNIGRDNYVLLRFSESVIVDSAFLGYVVGDSDLKIWIGTINNAYNGTVALNDATLAGLGFTEVNLTELSTARTADLNAGNVQGNVLVIAADPGDDTPEDRFKIDLITTRKPTGGVYANKGTVTVPGDSDSDLSHYKNPAVQAAPGTIKGTKWRDITGNGKTSDDVPLAGTVIYLDLDNDGIKDSGDPSTTTAANGTYQFTGLAAGTYTVREVVTSNMLRTGPALTDKYVVTLAAGQTSTGNDFANFEKCLDCALTNVFYTITRNNSTLKVNDLRGNTNQSDVVTVTFTVPAGSGAGHFSLVSYTAPDAYFSAERASQQRIFEGETGFFLPGTHTMTVALPGSNYQVDFVCGSIIDVLGPANSNIFYSPQGRLISADNDGTKTGSANFQGVTLIVGGSSGNDDIQYNIASDTSKISVKINGSEAGQVSLGAGSGVTITRLAANGYAGNDKITVSNSLSLPAVLRGGAGNDTLNGGAGNDIIFGEAGADTINGNAGRDLLIGGTEADVIHGNVDDDILIGGTTSYDANTLANRNALEAIMSEWVRTDRTFAQRVHNISNGTASTATADGNSFSSRKNGSSFLIVKNSGQNVFDDNVKDSLYGDENNDWLLTNNDEGSQNDTYSSGERITDID